MDYYIRYLTVLSISFFLWLYQGCVTVKYQANKSDYETEIRQLEQKLSLNPEDTEALRNLGSIYFQVREYLQAKNYLHRAFKNAPNDPKTMFYLAMSEEFDQNNQAALEIYQHYLDVPRLSPYRRLMEGRYRWLIRQKIRQEMEQLIKTEQTLSDSLLSSKVVAVFPIAYQGKDERLKNLGIGLSEMIMIDLGHIKQLTIVERIRLQTLFEELALGQSGIIDPNTAPRLGRLLGAGRMIRGNYNVSLEEQLRLDIVSWDVLQKQFPATVTETDLLNNLFKLEKDLVFQIIENMGIELSIAERKKIQSIPTRNLQAFLAYSRGLAMDNANRFRDAEQFYNQAAQLDPDFSLAKEKSEASASLDKVGGDKAEIIEEITKESNASAAKKNQARQRLQQIGNNIGSNFIPGQDERRGAAEGAAFGVNLKGGKLPKPSPPPPPPPVQ